MRFLGRLHGQATLACGVEVFGQADYDFDGFIGPTGQVMANGEIRMSPAILRSVFGRRDLQLLMDGGRIVSLRFSERKLTPDGDAAHVDIDGDLPSAADWSH
ncbi:hypothetical protein [Ferrovibrio terrae]|uniref:hypothetical protein n=1 Tax=Ferrovibrio terrae TaxID=2594003 RepID=UPI003137BB95